MSAGSVAEHSGVAQRCPGTERWGDWPSPVGLTLGILAALAGQVAVIVYHYARMRWSRVRRVQSEARPYAFGEGVASHLANPGGILLMVFYLCAYWLLDLMPCSYYSFAGGVRWWMVFAQICCQDGLMFLLHYFEHKGPLGPAFYQKSHKPHHRFVNPRLFDAFDGSVPDTFCMILVPLATTAQLLHANVWEYMLFGSLWSAWLCLIHSEVHHPWDPLFRLLGLGTAADHHVHHRTFIYNYGHTMMWWDRLLGTYRHPDAVRVFNKSGEAELLGGTDYAPREGTPSLPPFPLGKPDRLAEAAVYAGTRGEAGKAVVEHGGAGAAPRRREQVEPGARAHED